MSGMRCSRPCCRIDQVGKVGCMKHEAQLNSLVRGSAADSRPLAGSFRNNRKSFRASQKQTAGCKAAAPILPNYSLYTFPIRLGLFS